METQNLEAIIERYANGDHGPAGDAEGTGRVPG
jgi:hypothetical protein